MGFKKKLYCRLRNLEICKGPCQDVYRPDTRDKLSGLISAASASTGMTLMKYHEKCFIYHCCEDAHVHTDITVLHNCEIIAFARNAWENNINAISLLNNISRHKTI
jgi:hypothetical protein